MDKYKVLNVFKDKDTNKTYVKNEEIELSEKRAKEVIAVLGKDFIERLQVAEKAVKVKKSK